jgi:signal transduction histidine kinase
LHDPGSGRKVKKTGRKKISPSPQQKGRRLYSREILEKTTYNLKERVKELNCLYSISSMVEKPGASLEEILQGTVNVIPLAWQYPEITCSRILLKDRTYMTDNFRETPWQQSQPILVQEAQIGVLDIFYLDEKPEMDEGPFLAEERSLIKVIAERIGGIIERKQSDAALKESEARNRALLDAIPDLMFQIDKEGTLIGFHEGKYTEHRAFFDTLIGENAHSLAGPRQLLPKRLIDQAMMYVKRAFATGKTQVFEQHVAHNGIHGDFEIRVVVSRPNEALGMVRDITLRKRLEREILEISGREQRRIGQDLHDSLCQHLAGIGFMAKVLEKKITAGLPVDASHSAEMVALIDQAITLTRGFARGLNPVRLESDGLMVALAELAANTERLFGVRCRFEHDEPILIDDNSFATHLYRIVQEALNNAIKHGKAGTIDITFQSDGKINTLTVKDDGVGMGGTPSQGKGMGLNIMNYRASMIAATLEVRSHEDGGTAVICSFPSKRTAE